MIDSNREEFEKLPEIKAILQSGFQFNEDLNQYYHLDHTSHRLNYAFLMGAWFVWQASAQREGYKLVPVEPEFETMQNMNQALRDNVGETPKRKMQEIYKAMIGAAP